MALHNGSGVVVGAMSVATPVARFRPLFDAGLVQRLATSRHQLELDIAANPASRG
jgi:DNA-binding IclR family transcriptional regulator